MTPLPAYAELHCHSNFSFLDGASHPDELVAEAARLGLSALALTDHDGFYGVVRFAVAAAEHGLPTVFGAELTLGVTKPQNGMADPEGDHLVILANGPVGHARLARVVSEGQMAGEKGAPRFSLRQLADAARAPVHQHPQPSGGNDAWFVLTGCRKGTVPKALLDHGPAAAERRLHELVEAFGRDRVLVELWDHGDPLDRHRNDGLAQIAARSGVEVVATNNVHYATSAQRPLAAALAAVRARRSLDEIDGWLPASPFAHLRSPAEQARRFARWPGAVETAAAVGGEAAFDIALAAPNLPDYPVPPGHTEMTWLRELVRKGGAHRYPPEHPHHGDAQRRIAHELDVIEQLGFPGYFLLVHDIVEFCNSHDIYCQGRGSAANSAVCYALGITKADAVSLGLLFERFLSPEREGPPDIDVDIENGRREEAIQYVYERYGRDRAAQVANVITYRRRSAVREMAKACGLTEGQADALSKQVDFGEPSGDMGPKPFEGGPWGHVWPQTPYSDIEGIPPLVAHLASQVEHFPRHLGIHSGGMVLADRPLTEYCPVEWARMENRTVLQWDKDDCAAAGLVKFDLLGLGMLTAVHLTVDLIREHRGVDVDLAALPQEEAVYDMLCEADTVGVFQVESRAQMATLPRLRPRCFYDLVVEVALIRPGPIQGDSVHPYLARRSGSEPVAYLHPLLERSLAKTLGVPIFQEQLMQMAIDVAGFTPGESDQLRQAMGSKRSKERMAAMRQRLMRGMAERGITGETADAIAHKLEAFAEFGFPESHAVSFAYLVYSSAWLKLHYPAEFLAGLLNAQPMGFYSQNSLVRDAMRHGVTVLGPDVNASRRDCTIAPASVLRCGAYTPPTQHRHGKVRLGLRYVRSLGDRLLERIEQERGEGRFRDLEDFVRRTGSPVDAVEALATAGALEECFGLDRRAGLWAAGATGGAGTLPGLAQGIDAPPLPGLTHDEETAADLWATGIALGAHPTELVRPQLVRAGVRSTGEAKSAAHNSLIDVAGVVTHRQRPATARGVVFLNLEDETGMLNVIVEPGVWRRYRKVARGTNALVVRGVLENTHGVANLIARRISPLAGVVFLPARDFR
ncbi:MAG: error-prone DNA polymerase [Actinobacteria bacterium]|nr:error-prone DNA polymerase [Actinomycetota bacterium]